MTLALFDLDNTLLNGDSDHAWGEYLIELGLVDRQTHRETNDRYYQQYLDGKLDIIEYNNFQLAPLSNVPLEQLSTWRSQFIDDIIEPMIVSGKAELLEKHREQGDTLLIITATNDFVTRPIATRLGVDNLIATTAEFVNNRYTGRVLGTPSFQQGKVTRLHEWLKSKKLDLRGSWFYSDSHNDLPLLLEVDHPVAVTPDDKLRDHAQQHQWPIID